jgi:hypothetical protein
VVVLHFLLKTECPFCAKSTAMLERSFFIWLQATYFELVAAMASATVFLPMG